MTHPVTATTAKSSVRQQFHFRHRMNYPSIQPRLSALAVEHDLDLLTEFLMHPYQAASYPWTLSEVNAMMDEAILLAHVQPLAILQDTPMLPLVATEFRDETNDSICHAVIQGSGIASDHASTSSTMINVTTTTTSNGTVSNAVSALYTIGQRD